MQPKASTELALSSPQERSVRRLSRLYSNVDLRARKNTVSQSHSDQALAGRARTQVVVARGRAAYPTVAWSVEQHR